MTQKKIHLIRAAQAKPFVETASRLGAPVRKLAKKAGLPLKSVRADEGVIGEHSLWEFVTLASKHLNCEHFGYFSALDHPVHQTVQLGGMKITCAISLKEILEKFIREVITESDNCDYQLINKSGETWFTRRIAWRHEAGWIAEQYVLSFIIQIIRLCAPGDWLPQRMRIATRPLPVSLPAEWSAVFIDWGWPRTEILIENELLTLPPRFPNEEEMFASQSDERNTMLIEDLVDRQIWEGNISQQMLADELGMSISTLKRRLSLLNTSFSAILRDRRVHHATHLIEKSALSIGHIANMMGYTSVSNFSRAFQKATGKSPGELRVGIKP